MSTSIPSVLLVGATGYANSYLNELIPLHEQGALELSDAVVINPEEAAGNLQRLEPLGTRIHANWPEELNLKRKPNLVCLPVGIPAHVELTEKALALGANVLLEKPAAGSMADWQRMMDAESIHPGWVSVGFQHIYSPELQRLKAELCSGVYGAIHEIQAWGSWPRGDAYYNRNRWAGTLEQNGTLVRDSPLNNAFAHFLNLSLYLSGSEPRRWNQVESVQGGLWRCRAGLESFDSCRLLYQSQDGTPLKLLFTHNMEENRDPRLRITCADAVIEWGFGYLRRFLDREVTEEATTEPPHRLMFLDMLKRIENPEHFTCRLQDAGEQVRAVEIAHEQLDIQLIPDDQCRVQEEDGSAIGQIIWERMAPMLQELD